MLDIVMIAAAVVFFGACLAYMVGCERLLGTDRS
jgi:hypothetical protein